jgi:copper homeostasis protein
MSVTCHRAFDMTKDLSITLEDCISCGFDRVLTSGGFPTAIDGVDTIASLNLQADGRINLMPGSGINEVNVQEIVRKTRANQVHFSASIMRQSDMAFQNSTIQGMGSGTGNEYNIRTVDPSIIKRIINLVSAV